MYKCALVSDRSVYEREDHGYVFQFLDANKNAMLSHPWMFSRLSVRTLRSLFLLLVSQYGDIMSRE